VIQGHLHVESLISSLSKTPTGGYNPDINHPASLHPQERKGTLDSAITHPGALTKKPVKVVVTGAAGNIGYSIVFMIGEGQLLGPDQPLELRLLGIPGMEKQLHGLVLELEDCAYPLLAKIIPTTDYKTAFLDVDIALLIGARPRGPGMQRKDLLTANAKIFSGQGKALDAHASRNVKVLVVGNPANTNALIALKNAPSIPKANFTCLTYLDQNRAKSIIAQKVGVPVAAVKNVVIWGNHSKTQYPDVNHAYIVDQTKGKIPVRTAVKDDAWLNGAFITDVQDRGAVIIEARQKSSAASAAQAAVDHVRTWFLGSHEEIVSMGLYSDGSLYGIPKDLIFSFPVITKAGSYEVVRDLKVDEFSRKKLTQTTKELLEERDQALSL